MASLCSLQVLYAIVGFCQGTDVRDLDVKLSMQVLAYIRACVFRTDARHRTNSDATFTIQDIDYTMCSHYIYASALVDGNLKTIIPKDPAAEEGENGLYMQFTGARRTYPGIKLILSIGDLDPSSGAELHKLATKDSNYSSFTQNAMNFLRQRDFDGLNVQWDYFNQLKSKLYFFHFLQVLHDAVQADRRTPRFLLTVIVSGRPTFGDLYYKGGDIHRFVDFVFVQSYDLTTSGFTSCNAALYDRHSFLIDPSLNVNASINFWKGLGVPTTKLVLGIAARGPYLRLLDPTYHQTGSPVATAVLIGPVYKIPGYLVYPEICRLLANASAYYDNVQKCRYLVMKDSWASYEDLDSLNEKGNFVKQHQLAGIMFAAMDEDDFTGKMCGGERYPTLSILKRLLPSATDANTAPPTTTTTTTTTIDVNVRDPSAGNNFSTEATVRRTPSTTDTSNTDTSDPYLNYILFVAVPVILVVAFMLGYGAVVLLRRRLYSTTPRSSGDTTTVD